MIELNGITKRYGSKYALRDVSLTIAKGGITGLLGRNGAGKSTAMNIITGYVSASSGRVLIDGEDVLMQPRIVRSRIGYMPEIPPLYPDMTVNEYLKFACAVKDVRRRAVKAHIDDIAEKTRVADVRTRLIRNLSKGYRQRVGMAQALVGDPEILILDEPTAGLDPMQISEMRNLIRDLGQKHTVVLSSHILREISDICSQVIILHNGRVAAQDTVPNLTGDLCGNRCFRLRAKGNESAVREALAPLLTLGATAIEPEGETEPGAFEFSVSSGPDADLRARASALLSQSGLELIMLRPMNMELEEVFMRFTAQEGSDPQ